MLSSAKWNKDFQRYGQRCVYLAQILQWYFLSSLQKLLSTGSFQVKMNDKLRFGILAQRITLSLVGKITYSLVICLLFFYYISVLNITTYSVKVLGLTVFMLKFDKLLNLLCTLKSKDKCTYMGIFFCNTYIGELYFIVTLRLAI